MSKKKDTILGVVAILAFFLVLGGLRCWSHMWGGPKGVDYIAYGIALIGLGVAMLRRVWFLQQPAVPWASTSGSKRGRKAPTVSGIFWIVMGALVIAHRSFDLGYAGWGVLLAVGVLRLVLSGK
jgi:hypothetical protein